MATAEEFRFEIEQFTPTTLPLRRLQDYIPLLVELFGNNDDVHLLRIDEGSAVPCIHVTPRVVSKVEKRLLSIKTGGGSRKSYRAVSALNDLLTEDNTSAVLRAPHFGVVIEFPGSKDPTGLPVGPIAEAGEIQGELFQVGGRDETISLYIRDEANTFICTATRQQGREISAHLFNPVRVYGDGKWLRTENGKWKLITFRMRSFAPLANDKLSSAIDALREMGRSLDIRPDISYFNDPDED